MATGDKNYNIGSLTNQETILEKLDTFAVSIVKSVQRIDVSGSSTVYDGSVGDKMYYKDITIDEVDMNKTIVLVTGHGYTGGSTSYSYYETTAKLLNSTTVRAYSNQVDGSTGYFYGVNVQVVEFY